MTDAPTLKQQVSAVELAFTNLNGAVEVLRGLVAKNKRTPQELAMKETYLPALRQAVLTMRFIETNAERIRELTKGASGDAGTRRAGGELRSEAGGEASDAGRGRRDAADDGPDPY